MDVFERISKGEERETDLEKLKKKILENKEQREIFGVNRKNIDIIFERRIRFLKKIFERFEAIRTDELKIDTHLRKVLWDYYIPFSEWVIKRVEEKKKTTKEAYVLGLCGAQGSGKTTFAQVLTLLLKEQGYNVVVFSLDDIYKTYKERERLRKKIPEYTARGPPGTHDVKLGLEIIKKLKKSTSKTRVLVPVFDKSLHKGKGDRLPEHEWKVVVGKVDIVIFEGWIVGARPIGEDNLKIVHEVEKKIDPSGRLRKAIDRNLRKYEALFNEIDDLVVLDVPGIEKIEEWRKLQEEKLRERTGQGMKPEEVEKFVEYYIPSTIRYVFSLKNNPDYTSVVFRIGPDHNIRGIYKPATHLRY